MIFGNTAWCNGKQHFGTVYRVLEGKGSSKQIFISFRPVRGLNNRKEAEVTIAGKNLRVCILYGTAAAEEFLAEDMSGYHFVEVMTCPGGCISGAGQPDCGSVPVSDACKKKENRSHLYQADERAAMQKFHG
ncbi:MAG: [Fe-Fe] hydrogenase large subunit C-terminal domain-containing protein [Anaerobutyricum soehngenii]